MRMITVVERCVFSLVWFFPCGVVLVFHSLCLVFFFFVDVRTWSCLDLPSSHCAPPILFFSFFTLMRAFWWGKGGNGRKAPTFPIIIVHVIHCSQEMRKDFQRYQYVSAFYARLLFDCTVRYVDWLLLMCATARCVNFRSHGERSQP